MRTHSPETPNAHLVVTDLDDPQRRTTFRRGVVVFGRKKTAEVHLEGSEQTTSLEHAEARKVGERWVLKDLGSKSGTWIGGSFLVREREIREPLCVEFGRGGPRLRLETVAAPAETGSRSFRAMHGTTAYLQALVASALRRPERGRRVQLALTGAALLLGIGVLLWLVSAPAERDDRGALVAQASERSLFMLIALEQEGARGFCTAFAVTADGGLATNAHCVERLAEYRAAGVSVVARMNRAPELSYEVVAWKAHPGFDGSPLSLDVGLLRVAAGGPLQVVAPLADDDALRELVPGRTIYTLGFAGEVMNEAAPAADFRVAAISRLTTTDNAPGDGSNARIVWHSALTSHGTSGSPIFDVEGRVIAVASGGLSGREIEVADGAGGTRAQIITEANGLNFGVRIDAIRELLAGTIAREGPR